MTKVGMLYICTGKYRSIVDSVTDHGNFMSCLLQGADLLFLLGWKHTCDDLVNADLLFDRLCGHFIVTG